MRKKMIAGLLICLWALTSSPAFAKCVAACPEETAESNGFCYTEADGEITITDYAGAETDIVIPDEIEGTPVVNIGDFAFAWCENLESVVIDAAVETIGQGAFFGCTSLIDIDVDAGNAQYSSVDGVLYSKDQTELIQYPAGKPAESFTIPETVTGIAESAFAWCQNLTSVVIDAAVETIGQGAFFGCTSLTDIDVDADNAQFSSNDGILYSKDQIELIQYPAGKPAESFIIPETVTDIAASAFAWSQNLTSVVIGETVENIGQGAFFRCAQLVVAFFLGDAPEMGIDVFEDASDTFKICYTPEASGFESPAWQGYPAETCDCLDDDECDDDFFCVDNQCVECRDTDDCPDNLFCVDNVCVECRDSDDCPTGFFCVFNQCVECVTDDDCDDRFFCSGGQCMMCVTDVDCPVGFFCFGDLCVEMEPECVTDAGCPAGFICENEVCVEYVPPACALSIRPATVRSGLLVPKLRAFHIIGSTGFEPFAPVEMGNWSVLLGVPAVGRSLIVLVIVPPTATPGLIPVRAGDCNGWISVR